MSYKCSNLSIFQVNTSSSGQLLLSRGISLFVCCYRVGSFPSPEMFNNPFARMRCRLHRKYHRPHAYVFCRCCVLQQDFVIRFAADF
eukprot:scaffold170889_cov40-Prasinocladus_malaysianus.AAC.1